MHNKLLNQQIKTVNRTISETNGRLPKKLVLLTASAVMIITLSVTLWVCFRVMKAEAHVRYVGISNLAAEKIAMTVHGMEMNAKNVFDEVAKNMDTPDAVVTALECKTELNPEVKGYFAAFEPDYFKQKGRWYEPYVHHKDSSLFVVSQVGSARHDYTQSNWYIRAKEKKETFWSDPYYYQDNDEIGLSGHYCTFVKPLFNAKGQLACVCGADITLEWMAKKLRHIDESARTDGMMNRFHKGSQQFYTVLINHDGSPIAHPEDKPVSIKDAEVLSDIARQKNGMKDMTINGVSARVYYTPIENINWTVVLVVPTEDIWMPLIITSVSLFVMTIAGIFTIFTALRMNKIEIKEE